MALTDTEIKKRLVRLSNLEKLHTQAIKQNDKLRRRNKDLKARVSILETTTTKQLH
jgi:cell division protein FtsB